MTTPQPDPYSFEVSDEISTPIRPPGMMMEISEVRS